MKDNEFDDEIEGSKFMTPQELRDEKSKKEEKSKKICSYPFGLVFYNNLCLKHISIKGLKVNFDSKFLKIA